MPDTAHAPQVFFDVQTGIADETVWGHIRHALSLGLPEVQVGDIRAETLHIYANGPSARAAERRYPCMALNGALGLFTDHGPTYWAACDAQELAAGFLTSQPQDTQYLIASKCHSAVFDALKGKDIKLWHVGDVGSQVMPAGTTAMPSAISITICALFLAHYMGYRKVTLHGWDGCYGDDGADHAVPQDHDASQDLELDLNGRSFKSTRAWACETEDASTALNMLRDMDITITGDGLFANALKPFLDDMHAQQGAA